MIKNVPANIEYRFQSPGQEDPLEKQRLPTAVILPGNPMDREDWWAIVHEGHKRVGKYSCL